MKILLVAPTDPSDRSFGGALRTSDLASALSQIGQLHTLVVQGGPFATLDPSWSVRGTRRATYEVQGGGLKRLWRRMKVRSAVRRLHATEAYDVIVARYVGQAVFVPSACWHRLVLDPDDIYKSVEAAGVPVSRRVKTRLRNAIVAWVLRQARHVWIVNPQDAARLGAPRMSLLGNVVELPPETPVVAAVRHRILMVGYFRHEPNAAGLRWFATHVLPFLTRQFADVELHAVGKCPDGFERDFGSNVVVRGFVEDLAAEYRAASMVIAPIASGGGSQIKVIEALAHRRPLVASTFSHKAFADRLRHDEHLLVAESQIEWQTACSRLLNESVQADDMGLRGQRVVRERYGIDAMVAGVRKTFDELNLAAPGG